MRRWLQGTAAAPGELGRHVFVLCLTAAFLASQPLVQADTDEVQAVEAAHKEIWRRFINPHGLFYDYTGLDGSVLVPTPEECRADKPNALGWWTPIENGAFFGGLYLDALCNRWRATKTQTEIYEAVKVATLQYRLWNKQSPRRVAEADQIRDPIFAAWIVALSGNRDLIAKARDDMRGALTHYRWEKLNTCLFFMAENVYWQLRQQPSSENKQ